MKTSLIIPAYYANKEIEDMTQRCISSASGVDEIILQVDPTGEGYSVTTNKGLKRATGDILIVGNNDLLFPDNWLTGLLRVLEEGFDLATCWTSDQKYELDRVIAEGDKFGALFAMRREIYDTIGGFDEQFKGYFTDDDYRVRLTNAGFRIGMNYGLVVEHQAKATYSLTDPDDREYEKAKLLFEMKHEFIP